MTPRFHFLSPRLTFALAFYSTFQYVSGDRNVTVDDSDGSISYSTGWSVSSGSNSLDYGGYHHLSDSKTATASFTFTGIAVYIMAPLWPYAVGAQAGVDGSSPVSIDMQDHTHTSDGGSEDVASAVLWGMDGLSNSSHTLQISFWDSEEYIALDAIIYTVQDSSSTTASSSFSSSSSSSSSSATSASSASKISSTSHTGVIVGAIAGGIVIAFIVIAFAVCLTRRRRNQANRPFITGAAGAEAFVGGAGRTSRKFGGKSYASAAPDSPTMVSIPLGSPESFGNNANQNPNSMSYYSQGNSSTTSAAYQNDHPRNAISSFSGYGQPVPGSQYGEGLQLYGQPDKGSHRSSQYGSDRPYSSYNSSSAMASGVAAAATGGAHVGASLPGVANGSGNMADSYGAFGGPNPHTDPFLAAPGQIVLSYGGAASDSGAGSSSSRSDVYTTKPLTAAAEKRRLALAHREEEQEEEAPPSYS
ncbi:hypothetical protein F5879DRAFT_38355 [Lentinula edodes]|nr:hypothetical protein HHX47_DHR4000655 [Lentinula edodes]KAJ3904837.1 hypothetical protein F5879DRAFT_38355 [Lentinula edodes]